MTWNILIKECPKWHTPAVYVECEGNDCSLLTKPRPCTADSDCAQYPGTKCLTMANTLGYDFIQSYFTHAYYPVDSCGSPNKLLDDLKKWFSHYNTVDTPQDSLCFWDVNSLIKTVNITKWAESEYIVNGDTFSIRDLQEWKPANTDIPGSGPSGPSGSGHSGSGPAGEGSSSSLISFSWVLFVLILMIWTL